MKYDTVAGEDNAICMIANRAQTGAVQANKNELQGRLIAPGRSVQSSSHDDKNTAVKILAASFNHLCFEVLPVHESSADDR